MTHDQAAERTPPARYLDPPRSDNDLAGTPNLAAPLYSDGVSGPETLGIHPKL